MNTIINQSIFKQNSSLNHGSHKAIPSWIVWVQCSCFAALYSIWYYPQTNFLSDLCMVIGAVLSLYILFLNRSFFSAKESIPFWMLVGLFGWIIIHLLFLSNNYQLQLREFTNIWKRVAIAIIFALGFGIALANSAPKKGYWVIFYLGMIMPTIIYLFKYYLNIYAPLYGLGIPEYLKSRPSSDSLFFIHKIYITVISLPAFAISLAQLKRNLSQGSVFILSNFIYIAALIAIIATFHLENSKNGFAHASILLLFFILLILKVESNKTGENRLTAKYLKSSFVKILIIITICGLILPLVTRHLNNNPSWKYLWADSKVAIQVSQINYWKYWGAKGYPLNEYGKFVSQTNYERLAWGIVGLGLLQQNPLGYGLIQDSFGYLAKRNWPDSRLTQSHSGWLDLALGIGIPGIGLILVSMMIVLLSVVKNAGKKTTERTAKAQGVWSSRFIWVLCSLVLLWCTSEISTKIPFIVLMFWVSFGIGLSILASPCLIECKQNSRLPG